MDAPMYANPCSLCFCNLRHPIVPRKLNFLRLINHELANVTLFQWFSFYRVEPVCSASQFGVIPRRPFTRSHPSGGLCVGSLFLILCGCRAARDGELQSGMRFLYLETSNFGWLLYRLSIFLLFVRYIDVDFKKRLFCLVLQRLL
jgi:hypothetical protein